MLPTIARAHEIFDPIAQRLPRRPGVDIGRMFGTEGCGCAARCSRSSSISGRLVVKLPEARVDELAEPGIAERMVMRERPMREWVTVAVDAGAERWDELIGEAFAYLDEITPSSATARHPSAG